MVLHYDISVISGAYVVTDWSTINYTRWSVLPALRDTLEYEAVQNVIMQDLIPFSIHIVTDHFSRRSHRPLCQSLPAPLFFGTWEHLAANHSKASNTFLCRPSFDRTYAYTRWFLETFRNLTEGRLEQIEKPAGIGSKNLFAETMSSCLSDRVKIPTW